ncbi:MAG TPA: hypothetical protein VN231_03495 [Allosphingosinicella sp.]|nr:hypothetical protein [Allosphingosinicella sp.]
MAVATARNVFINCAFDEEFAPGFHALVFAVIACGFNARCAREMSDATETRIEKLYRIIDQSRFSIHDLSRTELDPEHGLPRFNMPLELGIFLGAKRFGDEDNRQKRSLVLDITPYRFQKFISDLAGMDITDHGGDPRRMVGRVRDWLVTVSRRRSIPSTAAILERYDSFMAALPSILADEGLDPHNVAYADFERLVLAWVKRVPPRR